MSSAVEIVRAGVRGLSAHKVQSVLSMLGVVFGVASVGAVVAIGEGARAEAMKQLDILGARTIYVSARTFDSPEEMKRLRLRSPGLSLSDGLELAQALPSTVAWSALCRAEALGQPVSVRTQARDLRCEVVGVGVDYDRVFDLPLRQGRFLNPMDAGGRARVCVVDEALAREAFPQGSAVGEFVWIGHKPYEVVGVLASRAVSGRGALVVDTEALQRRIYVPLLSRLARLGRDPLACEVDTLVFRLREGADLYAGAQRIAAMLGSLHQLADVPVSERDYEVSIPVALVRQAQRSREIFDWVLLGVAAISLLVGGIGIMNIMLATISERRQEIGLRRAVGATQKQIMAQFLSEATATCACGGVLGVFLGAGLSWVIGSMTGWETVLSARGVGLSLSVSFVEAVAFGAYPAYRAARLDPVDALRD